MTDDEDDEIRLLLDLNELPGQPAAFDSVADAIAALAQIVDLDADPNRSVELHTEGCGYPRCDCPRLTVAELMPSAKA